MNGIYALHLFFPNDDDSQIINITTLRLPKLGSGRCKTELPSSLAGAC